MFLCEANVTLEQIAWKGCGFSIYGDGKHLTGHSTLAACCS